MVGWHHQLNVHDFLQTPGDGEEIEKRWKEYMEELYKKDLNELDCCDDVVSYPEPDILKDESSGP